MSYLDNKKVSPTESAKEIEFAENFVNSAREIYLTENANSERLGCFTNEAIRKMANAAKLPDDSVMNHLFDCSECFRDYRQALLAPQQIAKKDKFNWWNVFQLPATRIALAGASFMLIVGLAFFWVFWGKQPTELAQNIEVSNESATYDNLGIARDAEKKSNNQTSKNETTEQTNAPENQINRSSQTESRKSKIDRPDGDNFLTEDRLAKAEKPNPKVSSSKQPSKFGSVNLVLTESSNLRNTTNTSENGADDSKLVLPARKVNLNVKLPSNFSQGRYTLRIVDAFGNVLLERKPLLKNRSLLLPNFNLQNLGNRANKLCLQKEDEIPDCFSIKIAR